MRRARRMVAGVLAAGALVAATAGCAQSVDPIERLGRKAAHGITHPRPSPAAGPRAHPHRTSGTEGAPAAVACPRSSGARHSPVSPLRHGWPKGPGWYERAGIGTGCASR